MTLPRVTQTRPVDGVPSAKAPPIEESVPSPPIVVVRNHWLAILAVLATIVFLKWASDVLIPITLAVLLSYALTPIVNWFQRTLKLHKAIGAALTLMLILGAAGVGFSALQPQALAIVDLVPRAAQKFVVALRSVAKSGPGAAASFERAAAELEKAANDPSAAAAPARPAAPVPAFRIRDYVWKSTVALVTGLIQFVMVVALVYFLLIAGDYFRRTLMRISEDTLSSKKVTLQMLDGIDKQIQRYLFVQIATSALLGVVAWSVCAWIGLENPATWGVIGGVLHMVPYVGPASFITVVGLASFVQFDTLQPTATIVGTLTVATGIIGLLLVPWLTHRVGTLNAVTVFVALLIWGWLWGVWGLLLGVPIMMAIKALCDRVENLRPIGAFLGHAGPT